jgi:hypothetical protein
VLAEHDVHESFSGDGQIVAFFGARPIDWKPVTISYNRYSNSFFRNPLYDLSLERADKRELKSKMTAEAARLQAEISVANTHRQELEREVAIERNRCQEMATHMASVKAMSRLVMTLLVRRVRNLVFHT